jgi:hypothetical protein
LSTAIGAAIEVDNGRGCLDNRRGCLLRLGSSNPREIPYSMTTTMLPAAFGQIEFGGIQCDADNSVGLLSTAVGQFARRQQLGCLLRLGSTEVDNRRGCLDNRRGCLNRGVCKRCVVSYDAYWSYNLSK